MNGLRNRIRRDERGASLILAIAFMLVAGAIGAGVTASVTSGIGDSSVLASARDREYAAEGAIDKAIVQLRTTANPDSIGLVTCPSQTQTMPLPASGNIEIQVDCAPAPEVTADLSARNNVILTACEPDAANPGPPCDPTKVLIRAEINFQVSDTTHLVTRTYVQTWSVSG